MLLQKENNSDHDQRPKDEKVPDVPHENVNEYNAPLLKHPHLTGAQSLINQQTLQSDCTRHMVQASHHVHNFLQKDQSQLHEIAFHSQEHNEVFLMFLRHGAHLQYLVQHNMPPPDVLQHHDHKAAM